jgi:hypothetical protein
VSVSASKGLRGSGALAWCRLLYRQREPCRWEQIVTTGLSVNSALSFIIPYTPSTCKHFLARASCGSSRKFGRSQPAKPGQQQRTTVSGDNYRALSLYVLVNPQSLELRASRLRSLTGRLKGQAFEFEGQERIEGKRSPSSALERYLVRYSLS